MTRAIVKYSTLNPGAIPEKTDFNLLIWLWLRVKKPNNLGANFSVLTMSTPGALITR